MIGLLILGQKDFAEGLIKAVEHTFGTRPPAIEAVGIDYSQPPERIADVMRRQLAQVDRGDGVLILADIYGTTHTNVACRMVRRGRVELISGASLPMVLRALTYRGLGMDELIDRTLTGGFNGIICANNAAAGAQTNGKTRP
jgi:mannose/fructose-specific phosphotransferase system component IIA